MSRFQSGPGGATIAAVIFVFATIICGVLAAMFYSDLEKAKQDLDKELKKRESFVTNDDLQNQEFRKISETAKAKNRSLLQQLYLEVNNRQALLTGSENGTIDDAKNKLKGVGVEEGVNAVSAVSGLKGDIKVKETSVTKLDENVKTQQEKIKGFDSELVSQKETTKDQIDKLQAKLDELEQSKAQYQQQVEAKQKEMETRFEQSAEANSQKIRERDAEIKKVQSELVRLRVRIKQMSGLIGGDRPKPGDTTKEIDGSVIAVNNDDNLVYVNLGRRDHLVLGMTFEVFDKGRGVEIEEINGTNQLKRGKASIEVMDIQNNSAVCRVVRGSETRPVLVGDVIANLIYAKDRVFKFRVYGDFDLDNDGIVGVNDYDQVINIIRQWGGRVNHNIREDPKDPYHRLLAFDTDYVVIGQEPELPSASSAADDDPETIVKREKQKEAFERYARLVAEARELGIPILTQNRFLALVGYYENVR